MEVFFSCSSEIHSNHSDVRTSYLHAEDDGKLIKLCPACFGAIQESETLQEQVGFDVDDLSDAEECSDCHSFFFTEDGELNECGTCSNCCQHFTCPDCGRHDVEQCSHCEYCRDSCCGCEICPDCDREVSCNECGYCSNHCGCDDADTEEMDEGEPWFAKSLALRKGFNCSRLIGVEWEYNHSGFSSLAKWCRKWRGGIHHDGSCGYEAVTPPLSGDYISQCLTDLGSAFDDGNAEADDRCGIHVHVDASDLSWSDMYRLLWVYSHVEPVLFLLGGQGRVENHYCQPCGNDYRKALSALDRKGKVLEVAYSADSARMGNGWSGRNYQRRTPGKKDGGRYRALNLCPWLAGRKAKAMDTTVEFRLHQNSLEPKRIIGWAQLCARMVDWAAKSTDRDAQQLPKSALRTLTEVIAPDLKPWILHRVQLWRGAFPQGKRRYHPRRIHLREGKFSF